MLGMECLKDLNALVNSFRALGTQYQAYQVVFNKDEDDGIAAFLKAESEERYRMAGMVERFISKHDGKTTFSEIPAPISSDTASVELLKHLVTIENQNLIMIQGKIEAAFQRQSFITHAFFVDMYNYSHKEWNEVKMVSDRIVKLATDPLGMTYYDNWLKERYGEKMCCCGECICENC